MPSDLLINEVLDRLADLTEIYGRQPHPMPDVGRSSKAKGAAAQAGNL